MSLEAAIQENNALLKTLIAIYQSGAPLLTAAAPAAAPAEAAEEKPKRGRPAKDKTEKVEATEGNVESEKAEQPATTSESTATTAPSATAQAAGASDEKPSTPSFDEVTAKIVALNKAPGHGRDSVLKVFQQFFGTTEGKRVPDLQSLGKNAEIIAFVDALLAPAAEDDLGI